MLIIGLIGSLASGKHLIGDILHQRYGFIVLDYKDFHDHDKEAAKHCLAKAKETWPKNVVVIGIDSWDAIDEMRDNPQFFCVAVDGPLMIRFQRAKHAALHSLEDFVAIDDFLQFGTKCNEDVLAAMKINEKNRSPLYRCMDTCDLRLINETSNRKDLEEKLKAIFGSYGKKDDLTTRALLCADWDQYFLMLAWITAAHGNCLRHRVGCVIANDDQRVVATGYNGTPDNIRACNEGGCQRCWDVSIEHGQRLDECICIHGEESALLEAGRNKCRNATMYVTHNPCRQCSKKIVQSGIKRVVYLRAYPSSLKDVQALFQQANIELIELKVRASPIFRMYSEKHQEGH